MRENLENILLTPLGGVLFVILGISMIWYAIYRGGKVRKVGSHLQPLMSLYVGAVGFIILGIIILFTSWKF